jgi:hypothetical protein
MEEEINLQRINLSLKRYPKLFDIFGEIEKVKNVRRYPYGKNESEHELNFYGILNSCGLSSEETFKNRLLRRLNDLCEELGNLYSHNELKRGILKDIYGFISELEFAYFCMTGDFDILDVEPKVSSRNKEEHRSHFKIEFKGEPVFVEVMTLRMRLHKYQYSCGTFHISDKVERSISGEFKKHAINDIKEPFIVVIDGAYAGIDRINIMSAVELIVKRYKQKLKFLRGVFLQRGDVYSYFEINHAKHLNTIMNKNS